MGETLRTRGETWYYVDVGPVSAAKNILEHSADKSDLCCFHKTTDTWGEFQLSVCECFGA